jgi:superfamily I DNA/RNA helicase
MFDTVNRIKGLEIPIMFLTNFTSSLEPERLYVSLSRAKHRLFIVGLESKIIELKKCLGLTDS